MKLTHTYVTSLLLAALMTGSLAAEPVTFTDVTGQEITLPALPQRIVTLPNPAAATVIALGGNVGLIIGMNKGSKRSFENGMMGVMFPETAGITSDILSESGGWMPNVEAIAALQPDLIIQWGGRGDDIVAPLRNAGLPVALMVGGGRGGTEELARENMRLAAEITGQTEKFDKLVAWRDLVMSELAQKLENIDAADRPSILHLRTAKDKLTATGEATYQNVFIELIGARNVADGLGVKGIISAEQILEWDPDIIMLSAAETNAGLEVIYDDPLLSRLRAAKEGRVYKTPEGGYIWDSASHESPFTWMWLANLAHPELFQFDLRQELRDGFKLLYNYELSEEEIERILRTEQNGEQQGYKVFAAQ